MVPNNFGASIHVHYYSDSKNSLDVCHFFKGPSWLADAEFVALLFKTLTLFYRSMKPISFTLPAVPSRRPYAPLRTHAFHVRFTRTNLDLDDSICPDRGTCFRLVHIFSFCRSSYSNSNPTPSSFEQTSPAFRVWTP